MIVRDAKKEYIEGITNIYNDAVKNTTAIWNEIKRLTFSCLYPHP